MTNFADAAAFPGAIAIGVSGDQLCTATEKETEKDDAPPVLRSDGRGHTCTCTALHRDGEPLAPLQHPDGMVPAAPPIEDCLPPRGVCVVAPRSVAAQRAVPRHRPLSGEMADHAIARRCCARRPIRNSHDRALNRPRHFSIPRWRQSPQQTAPLPPTDGISASFTAVPVPGVSIPLRPQKPARVTRGTA